MRIVGVLIWYDESPTWLAHAAAGFGRVCDEIVAVDGAYALYPGARPRSTPDQAEAILAACETMGVGCTIHRPKDVWWGNEIEKRQAALKYAAPSLTPGEDWVLIFDADYQMMLCEDPPYVRALLEQTDKNVVTYTIFDSHDVLKDETTAEVCINVDIDTEWTTRDRAIFRWTEDLKYGPSHFFISGTYDGEKQWLRGPDLFSGDSSVSAVEPDHLGRNLVVVHRNAKRAKVRRDAAAGYYAMRDQAGVENISYETVHAA
jgi:hypothetical protein